MVGSSVKNYFESFFFCSKMCVLCMFCVEWELEGQRKLECRDFLSKKVLG